jgi:hypothetical protein
MDFRTLRKGGSGIDAHRSQTAENQELIRSYRACTEKPEESPGASGGTSVMADALPR